MKELEHTLLWGGIFEGNPAHRVTLSAPDSNIALKFDNVRGIDRTTHKALSASTAQIEGKKVDFNQAGKFWDTVCVSDAEHALLELLKVIWPDAATENPQTLFCIRGHETEMVIDLNMLPVNLDQVDTFEIVLKDGFKTRDDNLVKRLKGRMYTLGFSISLEARLSGKSAEATYATIASCCSDADNPDRPLNIAQVSRMSPRDRKRVEQELEENHNIVELGIKGQCAMCPLMARGRIQLASFF